MTEVTFAEGITRIHKGAFFKRKLLGSISLFPSTLTSIDAAAFAHCPSTVSLLPFPASLTAIDAAAFAHCSSLVSLPPLHQSFTSIGDCAFYVCSASINVRIPDDIKVYPNAFELCTRLIAIATSSNTSILQYFGRHRRKLRGKERVEALLCLKFINEERMRDIEQAGVIFNQQIRRFIGIGQGLVVKVLMEFVLKRNLLLSNNSGERLCTYL